MSTFFWFAFIGILALGVFLVYNGVKGMVLSQKYFELYLHAGYEKARQYLDEHYRLDNLQPCFWIPGILCFFACVVMLVHCASSAERARQEEKQYMARYEQLIEAEAKTAWLRTEVGISATNDTQALISMLPKLSKDKKSTLATHIIDWKFKHDNEVPLKIHFVGDNNSNFLTAVNEDFMKDVTDCKIGGSKITFIKMIEVEKEIIKKVKVPGKLSENGIQYLQVNGKEQYFHEEERKVTEKVKTPEKLACRIS